jgi:hypothetical protein
MEASFGQLPIESHDYHESSCYSGQEFQVSAVLIAVSTWPIKNQHSEALKTQFSPLDLAGHLTHHLPGSSQGN